MKGFLRKFEDAMTAVAFAEAGEFETAREIMNEAPALKEEIVSLQREASLTIDDLINMAITFAEAGEHEKAKEFIKEAKSRIGEIKENISHNFLMSARNTN